MNEQTLQALLEEGLKLAEQEEAEYLKSLENATKQLEQYNKTCLLFNEQS